MHAHTYAQGMGTLSAKDQTFTKKRLLKGIETRQD